MATITVTFDDGSTYTLDEDDLVGADGLGYSEAVTVDGEEFDSRFVGYMWAFLRHGQALFRGFSTSSVAIGTGTKNFTITTYRPFFAPMRVRIVDAGNAANYILATVVSYDADTGAFEVSVAVGDTGGSGTIDDWVIYGIGERGEKGDTGETGAQGETGDTGPQGETGPQGATGATGTVSAAGDGTVEAPGYAWDADPDTGIRRAGAGDQRVVSEGSDVLTLLPASEAEAEAGTDALKVMTPERTAQAIAARAGAATGDLVKLEDVGGSPGLPAVDGSQLTGINGAGLVLLSAATASNDATVDFTTGIDGTYDEYEIRLQSVVPATDSTGLELTLSANAGSAWFSTSYSYAGHQNIASGSASSPSNSGTSNVPLASNVGSDAGESGVSGIVRLSRPSASQYFAMTMQVAYFDQGGSLVHYVGAAGRPTAQAYNAVRFKFASGNIESGEFKLYGVRKS
jgi:hypothetical protein